MRTTKADQSLLAELRTTQALLGTFGVYVYGYDPGITGRHHPAPTSPAVTIELGPAEWAWLAPLLRELLAYRQGCAEMTGITYDGGIPHKGRTAL